MAASRLQIVAKQPASLNAVSSELTSRAWLDASRRQASVEVNFSPRAADFACPRERKSSSEGVRVEVGHAVDISEQIRRLEANWNSRELAVDIEETTFEEPGCSGRGESQDRRSFLQQRWQALTPQTLNSSRRRSGGRRRRHSAVSRGSSQHILDSNVPPGDWELQGQLTSGDWSLEKSIESRDALFLADLCKGMDNQGSIAREQTTVLGSVFGSWVQNGLLSRETELQLGRIVQLGLETQRRTKELSAKQKRSISVELQAAALGLSPSILQARVRNGEVAQKILFRFNLRLVSSIAKSFGGKGLDPSDLIIDGASGLERAIQLYDPSKGHKFSTYAYNWIRQAMGTSIIENARVVRLPSHVVEMVSKIAKARQHLIHKHHIDDPTDQQISDSMGLDVKKVALYSQVARSHASLEDPGDSDALGGHQGEEDCLADVIKDYNPTADDLLMKVEGQALMKKEVDSILEGLSIRERNILRFRYGMQTERLSLRELSTRYGISTERVRQIGEIALAKLQLRQQNKGKPQEGRTRHLPYLKPENYDFARNID